MKKNESGSTLYVNCTEICATACKDCKERCMRECTVSKNAGKVNCKELSNGCCQDCKDDCKTVCDLCVES